LNMKAFLRNCAGCFDGRCHLWSTYVTRSNEPALELRGAPSWFRFSFPVRM
jgi:hypothetical protein